MRRRRLTLKAFGIGSPSNNTMEEASLAMALLRVPSRSCVGLAWIDDISRQSSTHPRQNMGFVCRGRTFPS